MYSNNASLNKTIAGSMQRKLDHINLNKSLNRSLIIAFINIATVAILVTIGLLFFLFNED